MSVPGSSTSTTSFPSSPRELILWALRSGDRSAKDIMGILAKSRMPYRAAGLTLNTCYVLLKVLEEDGRVTGHTDPECPSRTLWKIADTPR